MSAGLRAPALAAGSIDTAAVAVDPGTNPGPDTRAGSSMGARRAAASAAPTTRRQSRIFAPSSGPAAGIDYKPFRRGMRQAMHTAAAGAATLRPPVGGVRAGAGPGAAATTHPAHAGRWLAAYLAAVVAVTFVHSPAVLAALLAAALAAAGRERWRLLRRALLAVLAFNLAVSLGYVAVALWRGDFAADYLLLANLRVLLLVFLGFWFVARVNVLAAFAFSPTLSLLATLAAVQAQHFARVARDFRLAFASRNPGPASLADRARHASAQAATLLDKSVAGASETALAMRSRGVFDEDDDDRTR